MEGINLALLPPLDVVKQVDYEEIVIAVAKKAGIENASPSDPAYRVALAGAYREALLRQDANEQARGVMLAYAKGPQLDHIGATYYRHSNGSPVVRFDDERDDDYRERLQASPEGLSEFGPNAGYEFHARSAHPSVKGAKVESPEPVTVELYILSYEGDGTPSADVITAVEYYLSPNSYRRPLTDWLRVHPATILRYRVTAELILKTGPDDELVRKTAEASASAYVELKRALGAEVEVSGLHAVMRVEGVEKVILKDWADVTCTEQQAPFCEALMVTIGGHV